MSPMQLTVAYITGRKDPRVDWALSDLIKQALPGEQIEFLIIDRFNRSLEDLRIDSLVARAMEVGIYSIQVRIPKPNIWQGPHRVTAKDWWAMSNARNTALVFATHDYIAFLDDRCALGQEWLATVREHEAKRESVIAGAYSKYNEELAIEDDRLSVDTRLQLSPAGLVNCGGGWLFGATLAMPLEWALDVNGFEEGCDGMGFEDVIFGCNLETAGRRIDYVPNLSVHQKRCGKTAHDLQRTDKGTSPNDKSHAALKRFRVRQRTEFTPDLRELRATHARGEGLPIPDPSITYRDWFDDQPINTAPEKTTP